MIIMTDYIPTRANIKENEKNKSTLVIMDNFDELAKCDNKEDIIQISMYNIYYSENPIEIDLSKFINLKILYMHNTKIILTDLPESLVGIGIHQCYTYLDIPYKKNIKYLFSLSSMGDNFVDFSKMYHKYELDNFNYNPVVASISSMYYGKNYEEDVLDRLILNALN